MKIRNKSSYSTRDLRKFFVAGLKALNVTAEERKQIRIEVRNTRGGRVRGLGAIGCDYRAGWMSFALPATLDLGSLAKVLSHENAHNLGIHHNEMDLDLRHCLGPDPDWIAGLTIAKKPVKRPLEGEEGVSE